MGTDDRTHTSRGSQSRWPQEAEFLPITEGRATSRAEIRTLGPARIIDNKVALRRAVVEHPDDDAPRQAFADWMAGQRHELSRSVGAFVTAQLRVAQAFRANPRADVGALRSWRGDTAFVSTADFRAGDTLRPWFLDNLSSLTSMGLVGWPQVYRGAVERVGVRALRFLQIAEELFTLAPIRHLVLIGVPEVVDELAACPHLARIRSLSLPRYSRPDELTDDVLQQLIASPHLGRLAHLRVVNQPRLTPHVYEEIVTTPMLPQLSSFEVYEPRHSWTEQDPAAFDPRGRAERMFAYDTPISVMRAKHWIAPLEREIGYVPCVHPEDHYGRDFVDIEAVVEHPIALDRRIMARRGVAVPGRPLEKAHRR